MTIDSAFLEGLGADVTIEDGHDSTQAIGMPIHPLMKRSPFTIAFGKRFWSCWY